MKGERWSSTRLPRTAPSSSERRLCAGAVEGGRVFDGAGGEIGCADRVNSNAEECQEGDVGQLTLF